MNLLQIAEQIVAPFTDAWIETGDLLDLSLLFPSSHPSRVRGLKLGYFLQWAIVFAMSHPSRVRGLKRERSTLLQAIMVCRTLHGCVD